MSLAHIFKWREFQNLLYHFLFQHSCSLSQVLNTLVSHFRLAIECIAIQEGSLLASEQARSDDMEMPYHPEEALQIVDMTMKLIKSISDHGGREHGVHLIRSCPDLTVSYKKN